MKFTYCPKCRGALKQKDTSTFICSECNSVIYPKAAPTATALIIKGNKILLGKRNIEPSKDKWDVPGGFCNYGEDPKDTVKREALEETGLKVEPAEIIGIYMDVYGEEKEPTLNIGYITEVVGGEERAGDDLEELQWFDINNIPDDLAFDNGKWMIADWKTKYSQ